MLNPQNGDMKYALNMQEYVPVTINGNVATNVFPPANFIGIFRRQFFKDTPVMSGEKELD